MKRILLIFLLLIFTVAGASASGTVIIAKKKAVASGYCTSWTSVADADVICEDFASTNSCAATYDAACQATTPYTAKVAGASNTIDFTTSPAAGFMCTDTSSNAFGYVHATAGASNISAFQYDKGATANEWYVQFYWTYSSESLANTEGAYIFAVSTDTSIATIAFGIRAYQHTDGKVYLQGMYYNGSSVTQDRGGTEVVAGTWYGIRVKFVNNTATTGFQWWGNYSAATWTDEGANTTGDRAPRYATFGGWAKVHSGQIANIKIDDDTMPTDCAR